MITAEADVLLVKERPDLGPVGSTLHDFGRYRIQVTELYACPDIARLATPDAVDDTHHVVKTHRRKLVNLSIVVAPNARNNDAA